MVFSMAPRLPPVDGSNLRFSLRQASSPCDLPAERTTWIRLFLAECLEDCVELHIDVLDLLHLLACRIYIPKGCSDGGCCNLHILFFGPLQYSLHFRKDACDERLGSGLPVQPTHFISCELLGFCQPLCVHQPDLLLWLFPEHLDEVLLPLCELLERSPNVGLKDCLGLLCLGLACCCCCCCPAITCSSCCLSWPSLC